MCPAVKCSARGTWKSVSYGAWQMRYGADAPHHAYGPLPW